MTSSGLALDGTVVEIALIITAMALLVIAFLIGRLYKERRRGEEGDVVEALRKVKAEEQARIDELRKEREGIHKEAIRAQDALDRWEETRREHETLDQMRREMDDFEREESNRIDELERRRAEKARLLGEIETALASYPPEITGDDRTWEGVIAQRSKTYEEWCQKIEEAEKDYAALDVRRMQAGDDAAKLEHRKARLEEETTEAQQLLDHIKQEQIENLKPYNERLYDEAEQLRSENEELNQRKNSLSETITKLEAKRDTVEEVSRANIVFPENPLNVAVTKAPDTTAAKPVDEKLSAFRSTPECLSGYHAERTNTNEEDLLSEFEETVKDLGLRYPMQVIRAFHTALKVNDLSPLTVLSGLSGTGKSQLPRAYARFFGIHFLHVPVEPGWDSPQDILGFYDFVAERYRPTDRARSLGHFDSRFADEIGIKDDRSWDERMLIILLDEMNLARTEYYFSEFLSRLEMRGPRTSFNGNEDGREDAQIAIDLPYAEGERPKHLYVPHNVLWVGTLNEDETTQALSDKVLDRANSIRFAPPEPGTLSKYSRAPQKRIEEADGYLPYKRWLEWSERDATTATGEEQVDETLEQLATLMQKADRGFGYRIAQSIKAYIQRYPGQDWRAPMIDQINMRLLPKLAGAEMSDCHETVNGLKQLSGETLGDPEFASALQDAVTASNASQIFTWPGYAYKDTTA